MQQNNHLKMSTDLQFQFVLINLKYSFAYLDNFFTVILLSMSFLKDVNRRMKSCTQAKEYIANIIKQK